MGLDDREKDKIKLIHRLNRISGQIDSIRAGLEENKPGTCLDTIHQIKAINNGIKKFAEEFVRNHMTECLQSGENFKKIEKELQEIISASFTM